MPDVPSAANEYWPILFMAGFGVLFAVGSLSISWLLGEKGRQNRTKNTPYECGMPVQSEAHSRFSVKFYLVAMLFILFDVEVVFMFPWGVSYGLDRTVAQRATAPDVPMLLWEAGVFTAILLVGLVYVLKKGVLEWQKTE
jgi:NADH-quinone oxidoreductase subunit A